MVPTVVEKFNKSSKLCSNFRVRQSCDSHSFAGLKLLVSQALSLSTCGKRQNEVDLTGCVPYVSKALQIERLLRSQE